MWFQLPAEMFSAHSRISELSDSEDADSGHEHETLGEDQLRADLKKRLKQPCGCSKRGLQRGVSKSLEDSCFSFFQDPGTGFNGLLNFHRSWQGMHKLDQDQLETCWHCARLTF